MKHSTIPQYLILAFLGPLINVLIMDVSLLEDMYEKMKRDLIEAGLLNPGEDISKHDLMMQWQKLEMQRLRGMRPSIVDEFAPKKKAAEDKGTQEAFVRGVEDLGASLGLEPVEEIERESPRPPEGLRYAIEQLLNVAKGANYCMVVVGKGWVNLRYKKSKDNLYFQVAGSKYIAPLKVEEQQIKMLEGMGITEEPMSIDIFSTKFDDKPRDLDHIVSTIFTIFQEVYRIEDDSDAYIEIDWGTDTPETQSATKGMMEFLPKRRRENKFYWRWGEGEQV